MSAGLQPVGKIRWDLLQTKTEGEIAAIRPKTPALIHIAGRERDDLLLDILRRIENDTQKIGAPERTDVWQRGWAEALELFRSSPIPEYLVPKFIRPGGIVRHHQDFYQPTDPHYELNFVRDLQRNVIARYMAGCDVVHEFGCGTGFNLYALAQSNPDADLIGFDFVDAAVEMTRMTTGEAHRFDMRNPGGMLDQQSGIFTFGAIEQLGTGFEPFIEWVISQSPRIVLHIEPTVELYDPDNLVDALAIRFHRKRGYTEGLLPYLQSNPRVEMLEVRRTYFGSLMMEGYSIMAWRPR